jgi:cell division transport system permease protein
LEKQKFYLQGSNDFNSRDSIQNLFSPQLEDSLSVYLALPFRDVVFFNVRENFVNTTDLVLIKSKILRQKAVDKVYYEQVNMEQIDRNLKKALVVLGAIGAILIVLTFLVLYNTLKMALNYRSDVIYNQLLLGASPFFIARPMILRVLVTSVTAAALAGTTFLLMARFLSETVEGLRQLWSDNIVIYLVLLTTLIILTIVVFSIVILRKNLLLMRWEN